MLYTIIVKKVFKLCKMLADYFKYNHIASAAINQFLHYKN